jgi:hypothetical protein
VHGYAPHSGLALYLAAVISALTALAIVWCRTLWTGSSSHLAEKWIISTAAAAAPIPTYALLILVPLDPDLAQHVLEDRVVVALAGLYGLVETLKDIRSIAASAHLARDAQPKTDA